jgi:hypothetical protein
MTHAMSRSVGRAFLGGMAVALLAGAWSARAGEGDPADDQEEVRMQLREAGLPRAGQDPFAFVVDPATPAARTFAYGYVAGVGSGVSADRPIPVALQNAGLTNQLSLGYGLTDRLESLAEVRAFAVDGRSVASGTIGLKYQVTSPGSPWRAAVMGGALREGVSGASGVWGRAAGAWGAGPLLVEVNGYVERVFATGRDSVDYAVMGGASWRVFGWLRAGGEYVGQDLEEMGRPGAEGGARQAAGPSLSASLSGGQYQVVAATLFGIGAQSPTALVRVGLSGAF